MTTRLSISDLTALIDALRQMQVAGLEWEDASELYSQFLRTLDKEITIPVETLEKALWAVTLLSETGQFSHLYGLSPEAFIQRVTPKGKKYDKERCVFYDR